MYKWWDEQRQQTDGRLAQEDQCVAFSGPDPERRSTKHLPELIHLNIEPNSDIPVLLEQPTVLHDLGDVQINLKLSGYSPLSFLYSILLLLFLIHHRLFPRLSSAPVLSARF